MGPQHANFGLGISPREDTEDTEGGTEEKRWGVIVRIVDCTGASTGTNNIQVGFLCATLCVLCVLCGEIHGLKFG